jgi:HSP20 family molecular chaperone IbpA
MALTSTFPPYGVDTDTSLWDVLDDHPFFNLNSSFFRDADIGRDNRANVSEHENEYKIELEVPGYQKPELDIEFAPDERSVTISGKREINYEEEGLMEEPDESKEKEQKKEKKHSRRRKRNKKPAVGKDFPRYWVSERSVGEFSRTFKFASPVEHEKVAANLEHGVLTITIPKATTGAQPQKITIQ